MKRKRTLNALGMALLIASLILSACGGSRPQQLTEQPTGGQATSTESAPVQRKVAKFLWTQEFDTLSPMYTQEWFSTTTFQLWECWAWEYNSKNESYPKLLTEMPSIENGGVSADGKVLTMKLRDDIKWSDGTPITADDFIFTYQMYIDPKNTVNSSYPYDKVEKMEAPDPHTVVITFTDPFAPWEATLWKGILPKHVLQPVYDKDGTLDNAEWNRNPTVGCGPFKFAEWVSGNYARFVVNENYWLGRPKLDEIFIQFVTDDAAQNNALKAKDGDLGTFVSPSDVPSLKEAGLNIVTEPSGGVEGWFFLINKDRGNPALLDARVRKAIALAFDRFSLVKDLMYGLTSVPASYWDEMPEFWKKPGLEPYPYDPEEAKRLLDEAGWKDSNGDGVRDKDGVDLTLKYGTTIRPIRQNTQAVAQQQLANVGIKLVLSSYEADTFFADYANKGPAATGGIDIMEWSDYPAFPDPDVYYWLCSEIPSDDYPTGTNWQFLCDEELDRLIQLQASQINPAERQQTIFQIEQIFYDQVYWLGLWKDPDIYAVSPRLKNVSFSGVTPLASIMDWDIVP
jgi:peptide/nickel transport system substrate-binding protein